MNVLERTFDAWRMAGRFRSQLREHRRELVLVGLLGLSGALLEIVKPWPLKWIVDEVLVPDTPVDNPRKALFLLAGVLCGLTALKAGVGYLAAVRTKAVSHSVTRGIRFALFDHLVGLSPGFHARNKSGDLLVRLMGDIPMVSSMLVESSLEIAVRTMIVIGTIAIMLTVDASLTVMILLLIPVLLWVVRFASRRITIAVRKQRRKEGELADYLHEAIEAVPTVQVLGGGRHVVRKFARSNRRSARAGLKAARLAARLSASVEVGLAVGLAATVALGGDRVLRNEMRLGELLLFLTYVRSLLKPVRSASRHAERIAKGVACGERVATILDTSPGVLSGAKPNVPTPDVLAFDDVHYTYSDGTVALRGFSATFRRGELVGLAGANGAGKSTSVLLAGRLEDPDRGSVTLDGQDLRSFELQALRSAIGVAMQAPVLFGDSLRENLLLAKPDASDEELYDACRLAGFDRVLGSLSDGLETELGRAGQGLSGGERTRLSLARTLLRRTPVLIVDEPLAGLDRSAAARVIDHLRELAKTRIVVTILHDPEHLQAMDRVVVLNQGKRSNPGDPDQADNELTPRAKIQ